jgi:hypothetical protein
VARLPSGRLRKSKRKLDRLTFYYINFIIQSGMNNGIVTRPYLEAMVSADLVALAEEYGIDVPENLNRRFIIAELLDALTDMEDAYTNDAALVDSPNLPHETLPKSYNETAITAILRNPVWLYIYWDISESDMSMMRSKTGHHPLLCIVILDGEGKQVSEDSFSMPLPTDSRDQYILLPAGKKMLRAELVLEVSPGKQKMLTSSSVIRLPQSTIDFSSIVTKTYIPPMLALSGFREIIRDQFLQHRSFS